MSEIEVEEVYTIEMQKRIENYVLGRLNQDEIDELWISFLKNPDWFYYFNIELHLSALIHKN